MELGLTDGEFLRESPMSFRALTDRLAEQWKREDERFGVVAAVMANQNRKKGARPLKPSDFFPSCKPRRREQTPEEMLQTIIHINRAMGGEDKRSA